MHACERSGAEGLALCVGGGDGGHDVQITVDGCRAAARGLDGARTPRGNEVVIIVRRRTRRRGEDPACGHGEDAEGQDDEGQGSRCGRDETIPRLGEVVDERTCHEMSQSLRDMYV